jgi:CDGSH-type Zn-finger protein
MKESDKKITISIVKNGPYMVKGASGVTQNIISPDANENSWDWKDGATFNGPDPMALCRCGQSKNAPFCDGSHKSTNFDGTETASKDAYRVGAKLISGEQLALTDREDLCAYARFCDSNGSIWNLAQNNEDSEAKDLAIRQAEHCPSGRLITWNPKTEESYEEKQAQTIGAIEDPGADCSGPLWAKGGVEISSADGELYPVREKVTLCRCGQSNNKPFCDGSHAQAKWNDKINP